MIPQHQPENETTNMPGKLIDIITSSDAATRDLSLDAFAREASIQQLLEACDELDSFRRQSDNLYERVRALFFLYAIHRFHLPARQGLSTKGLVPFDGYNHLLSRRFEEAIDVFLNAQRNNGPSDAICSALAAAYKDLAFQTLANQVRRSVKSVRGNQWMFRLGHPADQPLRIRPELLKKSARSGLYPILAEKTPVRMDLTHSGWSDIFFLGMDFPAGAKVLNVSIDLSVRGRDHAPRPPVEAYLRVIDQPVLRLHGRDLDHPATEIADQHLQPAVDAERVGGAGEDRGIAAPPRFLPPDQVAGIVQRGRLGIAAQSAVAGDGQHVRMQEAGVQQLADDEGHAARGLELIHVGEAVRIDARQERHGGREAGHRVVRRRPLAEAQGEERELEEGQARHTRGEPAEHEPESGQDFHGPPT